MTGVMGGNLAMSAVREKFAIQVNAYLFSVMLDVAEKEGRQLQVRVKETIADPIEKRRRPESAGCFVQLSADQPCGFCLGR
jgi:hypothetical protein